MSGNAHQRRKKKRAKEREARKKMENSLKVTVKDDLALLKQGDKVFLNGKTEPAPKHIIKSEPPDEATGPTLDELIKYGDELPQKPIVQPEPSGEAEGALPPIPIDEEWVCEQHPRKKWPHYNRGGGHCAGPGMLKRDYLEYAKKKRGIWNWLRKLVTQIKIK